MISDCGACANAECQKKIFDERNSENYVRTWAWLCIYKNVNYLNDTFYDRLFNCLIRLIRVNAVKSQHPSMSCRSFPLCVSEHMTHRAAGLRFWKFNEKRLDWMANFRFIIWFFESRMNPVEMNIQSVLHAYRWHDS